MSHGRGLTNATPPAVAAHVLIGIATAPRSRTYSSYKTTSGTRTSRTRRATRAPRRDGLRGYGTKSQLRADYAGKKGSALSSVAAYAARNRGPRGDEPSSTGLLGLNKAACSLSKISVCTTRARRGCRPNTASRHKPV